MWRTLPWARLIPAALLLGASFSQAQQAVSDKMQLGPAFAAVICLVAACILLGSTLIRHAARPFTSLVDRIYYGSHGEEESPPLNLRLPRAYRAEGCYQQSVEECERQLEWHPLAPELWAELILANRGGGPPGSPSETALRERALKTLGMLQVPQRLDLLVKERDNLASHPRHLPSQFER